jgi:hypothetical protein
MDLVFWGRFWYMSRLTMCPSLTKVVSDWFDHGDFDV